MLPNPIYMGGDPLSIQWINSSPGWYFDPRFMKQYPTTSTKGPQSAKFSQTKAKSFRYLSIKEKIKEFTIKDVSLRPMTHDKPSVGYMYWGCSYALTTWLWHNMRTPHVRSRQVRN